MEKKYDERKIATKTQQKALYFNSTLEMSLSAVGATHFSHKHSIVLFFLWFRETIHHALNITVDTYRLSIWTINMNICVCAAVSVQPTESSASYNIIIHLIASNYFVFLLFVNRNRAWYHDNRKTSANCVGINLKKFHSKCIERTANPLRNLIAMKKLCSIRSKDHSHN